MEPSPDTKDSTQTPRRGFLAATGSILIGGVVTLTPLLSGLLFFLDPIFRRRSNFKGGDADGFLKVANLTLNDLPDSGTPLRFELRGDRIDAWNEISNQTIGTVYIRKMPGNQIIAFNDTCPHLGCKVEYQEGQQSFLCPCHSSAFELDGVPTNKIPPRRLDSLESRIDPDGQVWIKYQDFQCGKEEKKAV